MRRIVGIETEYGLLATADGKRLASDEAAARLFTPLAARFASTNAFLGNGGRLYLDIGSHPEYATPECTSAADLVIAQRAGDALLVDLAAQARAAEADEGHDVTFRLFRNNTDSYGNTWGSHENYLVARDTDPRVLADWLIGFLVSRQLIGGAGHWRRGRFTLSQRGDLLGDVVSNQTTRSRPLINTRDEPHADPARYRRLHVISGDTTSLDAVMWLTVAATELVLRRAEAGGAPPPGPADPLAALRAWTVDPDAAVPAAGGGATTARALQRAHLDATRALAESGDAEGAAAHAAWTRLLDDLDAGRTEGTEWGAKRRLIRGWAERHRIAPDDPRLDALDLRWHELGADASGRPRGLAALLQSGAEPIADPAAVAAALTRAPSASRARARGLVLDAARSRERDIAVDWASFAVHDLPGPTPAAPQTVKMAWDDPFDPEPPGLHALVDRLRDEPRIRALGGFTPPGPGVPASGA
ncbi:proteasome accessory factor PafA2 family protein [Propioniciclava coleopterorum]|uniref:Proteasome accessory factor PafA2 family protein n=1 Tax=Propioniciclava coleopterorum TaxID=2714937 RepID=A0A6G7YA64_9ACTN|nr:proteasome accessory factor PafA2 family protein [Propioniciclava coleopterorum]QIK73660.1 proteasome accessory factor PafA2 family protein [Propioniciclava coleopterorum]